MRTTARPRKRSSCERILPSIYCLIVYSDRPEKYRDIDWDVDADLMSRFTTLLGGIRLRTIPPPTATHVRGGWLSSTVSLNPTCFALVVRTGPLDSGFIARSRLANHYYS